MNNINEIPVKDINAQWTDAQWQAIHASGSDMLVAAAAGSGKTAVLVQRIIEKVLNRNRNHLASKHAAQVANGSSVATTSIEADKTSSDERATAIFEGRNVTDATNASPAEVDMQATFDFDSLLFDEPVNESAEAAKSCEQSPIIEETINDQVGMLDDHAEALIDIDRLLVMTFTNAAAAEMRERVGMALEAELEKNPTSTHLRRQFSLMNKAHISTIHSFCIEVIRSHFYQIDIDPGFRIANDTERSLLLDEAIETLLEREYGKEDNEVFLRVVNTFSNDRSDFELTRVLTNMLGASLSHPDPVTWLTQMDAPYREAASGQLADLAVYPLIVEEVDFVLTGVIERLGYGKRLCLQPNGPLLLIDTLEQDISAVREIQGLLHSDWESARKLIGQSVFRRAPSIMTGSCDPALKTRVADLRSNAREQLNTVVDRYFARSPEHYLQDLVQMAPVVAKLAELVSELHLIFTKLKKDKNLVDFNDLEHLALAILTTEADGVIVPSDIAKEYQARFVEVLVDEYQDTNNVQEMILQCIKRPTEMNGNLFMVGDVKQSIYRFRLADPTLFTAKYQQFTFIPSDTGLVIDLNQNFRSRSEVVDGVNYIFKRLMSERIGEIQYDQDASLKQGADFPDDGASCPIELHLLDQSQIAVEFEKKETNDEFMAALEQVDNEEEELTAARFEAQEMAQAVLKLMAEGTEVYDLRKKGYRALEFRDIVILYRSKTWYADCVEAFTRLGVPIYAEMKEGYFETTEVSVMLSLLKVIDNPYQDIPLAAVLRSPLVGLTTNQLAEIRLALPKAPFYEAVKSRAKSSDGDRTLEVKLAHFLSRLEKWNNDAKHDSVATLVWTIYRETNYLDFVVGLARGKQRQANLLGLYDRAKEFENSAFRGIFRFLRFIDRLRERGDDLGEVSSIGEQENVVRMMSIHASKGLEFPVVLLGGLARGFNKVDLRSQYLIDKDFGVALKYVDTEKRIMRDSLLRSALLNKKQLESISEEMRVLYVAMTRAKERLLLFATVKNLEKNVQRWAIHQHNRDWLLSGSTRANAARYLDWIGSSLVQHHDAEKLLQEGFQDNYFDGKQVKGITDHASKWRLIHRKMNEIDRPLPEEESRNDDLLEGIRHFEKVNQRSDYHDQVVEQMDWRYESEAATRFKAKQSVTEIKRMSQEADELAAEDLLPETNELVEGKGVFSGPNEAFAALDDHLSEQSNVEAEAEEDIFQLSFDVLMESNDDIAHLDSDSDEQQVAFQGHSERQSSLPRPSFLQEHMITPAERGTLMHLVMEHVDLAGDIHFETITHTLDRLVQNELITEMQRKVINRKQVLGFYQSAIGQRVLAASQSWREMPFSLMIPAAEVYPNWQGDNEDILVQGVIDCMFLDENDEIVIVDYKTDRIKTSFAEMRPMLQQRYQKQIELYTKAIEQITGKKVSVRCLYFFDDSGNELML